MQWEGQVYNAKDGQTLQLDHQAGWYRPARDSRLRAGLPVRRRNLDPRRPADSLEPRQQHGQGCAEKSGSPHQVRCRSDRRRPRRAEDHGRGERGPKACTGQKQAAGKPADPVGDICLLPDIARFAH